MSTSINKPTIRFCDSIAETVLLKTGLITEQIVHRVALEKWPDATALVVSMTPHTVKVRVRPDDDEGAGVEIPLFEAIAA